MNTNYNIRKTSPAALAFVLTMLVMGCSYTVRPGNVPPAGGNPAISFAGTSLAVVNAEKDPVARAIPSDNASTSGLKANRQEWCRKLTESLAGELARLGAQVKANAKLVLSVSLPEMTYNEDRSSSHLAVKALVTSSTGWSKTYEGLAKADRLQAPKQAERLAGQALSAAIKAMLGDAEFQAQLLKR